MNDSRTTDPVLILKDEVGALRATLRYVAIELEELPLPKSAYRDILEMIEQNLRRPNLALPGVFE